MSDVLETTILTRNFISADIRLVAIGKTGVGKSSTCNTTIGRVEFNASVGASSITKECKQATVIKAGRTLQVVDTPGFFDTQVTNEISSKITECVALSSPGPHAIFFVIRVGRFTEEDRNTVEQVKKWFGDDMMNYMIIIFTGQDDLDAEGVAVEDFISNGPEALKQLLAQVNNRYLTVNNRASDQDKETFTQNLLTMVDAMVAANGGSCYTTAMYRQAEERIREKEATEKKMKELELKRQRDEIEQDIKTKYAKILTDQDQQLKKLQSEMSNLQLLGQSSNVEYADKVSELQQKLEQAEQQRQLMDQERRQWEMNLQNQAATNENERNNAYMSFKTQLDTAINQKAAEQQAFSTRIEQERVSREQEINRRAEQKRLREEEEHRQRMAALEEERLREEERHRQEQQRQAEREAELQRQRAAAEAEARRRRHRHRNDCTVC